jgi:replicative DNA helicase
VILPNLEAEQSVIGGMIIDSVKVMPLVIHNLKVESFLITEHRAIIKRAFDLYNKGETVDAISILGNSSSDEIKKLIIHCCDIIPSLANIELYIKLVKENYIRYMVDNGISDLSDKILAGDDVDIIQNDVLAISELFSKQSNVRMMNTQNALLDSYTRACQNEDIYIKTGFSSLDKNTYISPADYIILGGRPSSGKTAFALNIMHNISQKHRTVFFSLETSLEKLGDRYTSMIAGVSFKSIKKHNISQHDIEAITDNFKSASSNSFFVEASGWNVAQIRAKAMELKAEVIFIDYIGLINEQGKSAYEKTTEISKKLHTLAQSAKITIFGLCQLNRQSEIKGAKPKAPTMSELRDSGQIEQDADAIILMHRECLNQEENTYKNYLILEKNKEGNTGITEINFYPNAMKFTDIDKH